MFVRNNGIEVKARHELEVSIEISRDFTNLYISVFVNKIRIEINLLRLR